MERIYLGNVRGTIADDFWLNINKRVGVKSADKLVIGNVNTGKTEYCDVADLPIVVPDLSTPWQYWDSSSYGEIQYRKNRAGMVELLWAGYSSGDNFFTLPIGFRPPLVDYFAQGIFAPLVPFFDNIEFQDVLVGRIYISHNGSISVDSIDGYRYTGLVTYYPQN